VVYTHLATFVVEEAGQPQSVGARIVSAIGVGNICGRIVLGRVADVVSAATPRGKVYLFGGSMGVSGAIVVLLGLPGVGTSLGYLIPFALLFGFSSGGLVSLTPPILVDALGLDALPLALGGTYSAQAATVLLFPPLGGWVRTATGSYAADWGWAGAVMLAAGPMLWAFPARPDDWYRGPRKAPPPPPRPDAAAADSVSVPVDVSVSGGVGENGSVANDDGKGG
jgi:predicted MFS family arabinose efflux permease